MPDLFKEKAEDYDSDDWNQIISSAISATILSKIVFHDRMHVMDFGAGTGLISSQVAPMVQKITAVDISESMLEKLMAKPGLKGKVKVICQDIMTAPIDEKFDLIMSGFAMHHVQDTSKLIQCFADHLETGSRVALIDLDTEDGSFHAEDNQGVYHCGFERDDLKAILEKHSFENIDFAATYHFIWEEKEYSAFLLTASKV